MILGIYRDISGFEKFNWILCYFSCSDFRKDHKKVITDSSGWLRLSILGCQNARDESSLAPDRMLEGKLDIKSTSDGRKLEEVSYEYDLHTSERIEREFCWLEKPIKIREKSSWKHRNLVNNKYRSFGKSLGNIFTWDDRIDIFITEHLSDTKSTPWVDRHTTDMSCCDSRRSRYSNPDAMFMTVLDKTIDEKCLSTSRSTCQEYILSHREYVECFILIHADECMKKERKNKEKNPLLTIENSLSKRRCPKWLSSIKKEISISGDFSYSLFMRLFREYYSSSYVALIFTVYSSCHGERLVELSAIHADMTFAFWYGSG